jgi:hypothetical protein
LDNVIVSNVSVTAASSQGILKASSATVDTLSLDDKLRLSVDSGGTFTVTKPLTVPTEGIELSGAGTLKLSDNLTLNGDALLASGSLTLDAKGILVNFGGDLNLSGGALLTDQDTNFHLLDNSTLTTNAEQVINNITIPQGQQPMLTLSGSNTKLSVVDPVAIDIPCPQSLPVQPKGQLRLPGGVSINAGGGLCIDGWLEGDIVLNGGTLKVEGNTSISSASTISIASASEMKLDDGVSLTYEGDAININANKLSVSGGGSLVLKTDGSNPLTLNNKDSELEFSGNSANAT